MVLCYGVLLIAAIALGGISDATARSFVDANVHRTLRKQGTVNIFVTMKDGTESILNNIQEADYSSRGDRISAMVESMEQHATQTQADIAAILAAKAESSEPLFTSTRSFWINNEIYIENASVELLKKLLAVPSIARIREEAVISLPTLFTSTVAVNDSTLVSAGSTNGWGVDLVQASSVWDLGYMGQNIVVSTIDSGVLHTHEVLKENFRSSYGWYDPESQTATPYDASGHGTATMGLLAGANGMGVAPGATWITCKGCRSRSCLESDLLSCAEFITCPTDPSGSNRECSKAPDLVSNSWVYGWDYDFFESTVEAWHAAGIIPIFANGNQGPECASVNSPGDYPNVIAVGATTRSDGLADYSGRGPSRFERGDHIKPDISAPGSELRLAWANGTSEYNVASGTSLATPHVSGVVALLLSKTRNLTYEKIKTAILSTAETATLLPTNQTCGDTPDTVFPNNQYGWGRINALKAFSIV